MRLKDHITRELIFVDLRPASKAELLDTLVHDADVLKFLMNLVGVNSLALGTDYPFPLGELQPGALIDGLHDVSEAEKNRMLGGTAREWLGI